MVKVLVVAFVLASGLVVAVMGREFLPSCRVERAGELGLVQECECVGVEVVRDEVVESGGLVETVCVGWPKEYACYQEVRGELFESECG